MSSRFETLSTTHNLTAHQLRDIYCTIALTLLAVLSIETIPLPISMYIAPATSLAALALLPAIYWLHGTPKRSPLLYAITIFAGYAIIQSTLTLTYDTLSHGTGLVRARLLASQLVALAAGASTYYVLRVVLPTLSTQERARTITTGALLSLIPAMLSVAYIATNIEAFAVLPRLVNSFAPTGFDGAWRANGFASEPAHFAYLLVTIFIPITLIGGWNAYLSHQGHLPWVAASLVSIVALAGTLSTTGIIMFVAFIGTYLILSKRWLLSLGAIAATLATIAIFVVFYPHMYVSVMIKYLISGGWEHSILTRYYSTIGPLLASISSLHGFVGYGFGSTGLYAGELLPPAALEGMQHASKGGAGIHLKTLIGRIVAGIGIPGLLLYAMLYVASYVQLARLHDYAFAPWSWSVKYRVIATALVIAAFGQGIGAASWAIPVVWLWFAWIDADSVHHTPSVRR
ncbi:hypothetical protein [Halomicrococcus sp. NG-SE-24]|uniref:hypothetical protein n=1 Tax=Halomicrococcus sp. NG-SE-24 TaxID=3436928 RepID=UPI003D98203E